MSSKSETTPMSPQERQDYGFARARDAAFDAVHDLWQKRQIEGMRQKDIAEAINFSESRLSRSLRGPGNWTLRTLGALVEGMDGELYITARGLDEPLERPQNFDAYKDASDKAGSSQSNVVVFFSTESPKYNHK